MKTRSEHRTRTVPKTIDGKTHDVTETYSVDVPVPPPDWDARIQRGIGVSIALFVAAALAFSAAAIGGLLSGVFPGWSSYLVAAGFDLAWVTCMALEYRLRYEPQKARSARRAGWAALCLSMALIAAEGAVHGSFWIGLGGSAVSLIAKGLWALSMKSLAPELDPASAQWVQKEQAEAGAEMATVAVRRQLHRTRARIREESAAIASDGSVTALEWRTPATDGLTADRLRTEMEDTAERIRTAQSAGSGSVRTDPDSGSVKDRVRALYESGTTDPAAVVQALPGANPETVKRMVRLVRTEGGYA
ncbi:hypothetical protein ACFYSF_30075 [Streptomyces canus]|uniref:hypothetical protein n=1 Tax=Streptomyces canus TaxID=58343 RepID=UPI003696F121